MLLSSTRTLVSDLDLRKKGSEGGEGNEGRKEMKEGRK
jgi:hypothetical protein